MSLNEHGLTNPGLNDLTFEAKDDLRASFGRPIFVSGRCSTPYLVWPEYGSPYGIGMATTKVTFTLDQPTLTHLEDAAQLLAKPKSEIVREAIRDYRQRIGKLSDSERLRMLAVIDEIAKRPPTRPQSEVDAELKEIRRARRQGGRRHRY